MAKRGVILMMGTHSLRKREASAEHRSKKNDVA